MAVLPFLRRESTRFRLRFLSQELDLPLGEAIIGRSESCDITIFDPLVSRQHASLCVLPDHATIQDLGSRNGTRINGKPVQGLEELHDGDRIGIGRNELVFKELARPGSKAKAPAGPLVCCASCQLMYARDAGACPNCASPEAITEITRWDVHDESALADWALKILVEVLIKALDAGAELRAERLMEEAITRTEERLAAGLAAEPAVLQALGDAALRLSALQGNDCWKEWILRIAPEVVGSEARPTWDARRTSAPPGTLG